MSILVFWHFWQQEQKVSLNLFDQENEQTFNDKIKSNIAVHRNQIEKFRSITKVALLQQKALSWSLMPVLMMEKFTGANAANKSLAASGIQRIKLTGSPIWNWHNVQQKAQQPLSEKMPYISEKLDSTKNCQYWLFWCQWWSDHQDQEVFLRKLGFKGCLGHWGCRGQWGQWGWRGF